ncbi:MAG: hypothetical protein JW738_01790 [Actinobacteria bacterium]|nr:hypothetical protein [Actinomycetota bacterium]
MNIIIQGLPIYIITLNQTPLSWNPGSRKHWNVRDRANKEWYEEFGWLATKIPRNVKHIYLIGEIFYAADHGQDADNAMIWKFTQDALVNIGVIPKDTPEFVTAFPPKISFDSQHPRTEIHVIVDKEGASVCEVMITNREVNNCVPNEGVLKERDVAEGA